MSSGSQFTINQYGQDRLVMDWFALQDPFDQYVPIKITNNWSGGLYFNYQLNSPPAWYSNFSGSLSGTLGGAVPLAAGASDTYAIRWNVSVSGQSIASSSPNTDTLTLVITAYTSGFLSGTLGTASLSVRNVLYNRYSGVIKVFGDNYSNNQPTPSLTQQSGTALGSGSFSYAVSYFLSGWESDVGASANATINSGFAGFAVAWTGVAGVTQYAIWRWSGTIDFTVAQSNILSGTMDLIAIVSGTSITDSGITPLQSGMYRHRTWQGSVTAISDTSMFLSPPSSRSVTTAGGSRIESHLYQIGKNISGNVLLGPFYVTVHNIESGNTGNPVHGGTWIATEQVFGASTTVSGSMIAPTGTYSRKLERVWYRDGFYLSGTSGTLASTSGQVMIQYGNSQSQSPDFTTGLDDVYIVANS